MKKPNTYFLIDTQQSKDDIIMDLTITAFDRFDLRELSSKFGGDWTTNKGETGGGGVAQYNNKLSQPE